MLTITIPDQFSFEESHGFSTENVEEFLFQIPAVLPSGGVCLDAEAVNWIEPIGCVLLRSLADAYKESGVHVVWKQPQNPKIQSFLEQMKCFEVSDQRQFGGKYCPVELVTPSNMDEALIQVKEILKKQMAMEEKTLKLFDYSASEMIENIFHHSEKKSGYFSTVTFDKKRKLQIVIVDNGIGVRKSLEKNPDFRDRIPADKTALELAIRPKVTSNPFDHPIHEHGNAGQGLFFAAEFIKANQGQFYFHSGNGQLTIEGGQISMKDNGFWQGTVVCLQFNLDYPINIKDVFDRFAPPDLGFEFLGL